MKSKMIARIMCIVLCLTIVGSVLLIAIPMMTAGAATTPVKGGSGTIIDDWVNLRSGAGTNYSVVTTMRKGTKVRFEDASLYNGWYRVTEQTTSKTGYVRQDFVQADSTPAGTLRLCVSHASTYAGCQYAFWQTGAKKPVWTSSNPSVAAIDQNGVATAKAAGTTTITVSEGSNSASCSLTVKNGSPTGIYRNNIEMVVGSSYILGAMANGVKWFSSNNNVATVNDGNITAKSEGYATISAYTSNGASTCLVKVTSGISYSDIKLCSTNASTYVGCQYAFWQTGATAPVWESSNPSVASIDDNGVITAKSAGVTIISCTENDQRSTGKFTVVAGSSTGISPTELTMIKDTTASLSASASGVKWYSSNRNVATVSDGVVTALSEGYATISAYNSGGASTCLIHVTNAALRSDIQLGAYQVSTYAGCQYAFSMSGATSPVWASSNPDVASVDEKGIVTANAEGMTTISVSKDGQLSTCKFIVRSGASTGISAKNMTLINGTTGYLTATASDAKWYSSNKSVVTVNNGLITAKSAGRATVSAYNSGGASTCLVEVTQGAQTSDIKLSSVNVSTYMGCQYALWQTGADKVVWSSSNPNVAVIDGNGVVTTKSVGVATVSAAQGEMMSTCKFTVLSGTSTGISKSSLTLEAGKTAALTAKTSGVKWFSSNKNVATVSGGTVTAKAAGYATISAYTSGGASTCLVKVTDPQPDPTNGKKGTINTDYVNLRSGAGTGYSIVTSMMKDTQVTLINETLYNGSWYYVQLDNGTVGYVSKDYLTVVLPPDIKLGAHSATTYVGCQYALSQTGADAPEWSSSDTSVVTVNANGIVTAKAAGTAVVTISQDGGSDQCVFRVKSGSSVNISQKSISMAAGKSAKLTSTTNGVKWYSSNPAVASVSGGIVTAKSEGYTTISAYTSTGAATCLVRVTQGDGTIKLTASSATICNGTKYAIGLTGSSSASWSSSNTAVATVDQNGVVTAKGAGIVTIRAANSVSSANCVVTVYNGTAPGISASQVTISSGKSILLKSDNYVSWSSSNPNVATVGSNGVVDTKAPGYTAISAYTNYGASTCLLHVTEPDSIRFVYATPNCAPKNSTVTFKAITDISRTSVKFVITNGTTTYNVTASSKTRDGNTYIWTGTQKLSTSGLWTFKAFSKTASTDFAATAENGEGEVFVSNSSDYTTTVLGERRASDDVIKLIANFEGFLPTVTADYITSDPTLGYGKVVTRNEQFYNNLTKNEAYAYLCQTVNSGPYSVKTNEFLTTYDIKFNQRQFDAIVCFAYNVGAYAIYNDSSLKSVLLNTGSSGTITAGGAGYVNTSGVNLRSGAGTNYSVVTTMSQNTTFTFVDGKLVNNTWYQIKLSNGTTGFIHSSYATAAGGTRDLANVNKELLTARILQYHHAAGSCYIGLLWRRVDEVEIFFYGDYERNGDQNKYGIYFRCSNNPSFGIG